jgi:hypothetical protein
MKTLQKNNRQIRKKCSHPQKLFLGKDELGEQRFLALPYETPAQKLSRVRMDWAGNDFWHSRMKHQPKHFPG